jgi:hypothetical protein
MQPLLDVISAFDVGDAVACAIWGVALVVVLVSIRGRLPAKGRGAHLARPKRAVRTVQLPRLEPDQSWNGVAALVDDAGAHADDVASTHARAGRQIDAAGYALGRLKADCTQVMLAADAAPEPAHAVAPALRDRPVAA